MPGPTVLSLQWNGALEAGQGGIDKCVGQDWQQPQQMDGVRLDLHPSTSRRRTALQHWVHEANYLNNDLQPPPNVLHTAVHKFNPCDADTATLEAMAGRGELPGALVVAALQSFALSRAHALGIGDKVELLVEMPTENEGETRDEWIDRWATIVKVEAHRFLIHGEADCSVGKNVEWFELVHVR